jgi:hypothetical protein
MPLEETAAYRKLLIPSADVKGEPISILVVFCTECGTLVRTSLD